MGVKGNVLCDKPCKTGTNPYLTGFTVKLPCYRFVNTVSDKLAVAAVAVFRCFYGPSECGNFKFSA